VDRVVLKAWYPMGVNPGGLRTWWRQLHGGNDDQLDNTHLMRMAGRFARRVKEWAAANGVPLILEGARTIAALLTLREHVIAPILAGVRSPSMRRKPKIWTAVDRDYETLRIGMQTLFRHVGIETQPAAA